MIRPKGWPWPKEEEKKVDLCQIAISQNFKTQFSVWYFSSILLQKQTPVVQYQF